MRVKIVESWIARGGIAGGRIKNVGMLGKSFFFGNFLSDIILSWCFAL
jgi:hypothetical protein